MGLPNLYGQLRIAPLLPGYLARHPQVSLQLNFDDRYADLVDRRLDVSVRIGNQFSGEFIARKLAPNPRYVAATAAPLSAASSTSPGRSAAQLRRLDRVIDSAGSTPNASAIRSSTVTPRWSTTANSAARS